MRTRAAKMLGDLYLRKMLRGEIGSALATASGMESDGKADVAERVRRDAGSFTRMNSELRNATIYTNALFGVGAMSLGIAAITGSGDVDAAIAASCAVLLVAHASLVRSRRRAMAAMLCASVAEELQKASGA